MKEFKGTVKQSVSVNGMSIQTNPPSPATMNVEPMAGVSTQPPTRKPRLAMMIALAGAGVEHR